MTQVQYTVEPQGRPLAVMVSIATLEQLVGALNNAEDALNNSQALIAGRERFGFAKPCYGANEIALGFVSLAITAGRAALANAEQQVPQWLPIETAPQNEKVLLACDGGIVIGMWRHYRIHNAPKFTHWMPLPAAPKDTP